MTGHIHLSPPDVGELEETYVLRALRSGWVAPLGPEVDQFEREIAQRVGVGYAVAVNSGTAALHLALRALGVGPGQVVVIPTLTFVATANAAVYTGAEPVFVDCEPATGNIDPEALANLLAQLRGAGTRVGAVVPVDLFGSCADYDAVLRVCGEYGVPVVADAAEAFGATYRGKPAGSFGHASVLSFNGNKIMTTSGGGMLLTESPELADRCRYLATQARQPVSHYEHTELGYNYRLSNVLAALGRAQLSRLDAMIARRRRLRERYRKVFASAAGLRILADGDEGANCWLTAIVVDPPQAGWRAEELGDQLARHGIETRPVWKPMHLQPVFAGARAAVTGAAEHLFRHGLTLPSGSALTDEETDRVLDVIRKFLQPR